MDTSIYKKEVQGILGFARLYTFSNTNFAPCSPYIQR